METENLIRTERLCKDCGTPLGPGREDRQYCNGACKTNYNNRKKRENQLGKQQTPEAVLPLVDEKMSIPEYITRIQEILLRNRRILESLCKGEKPGHIRMRDLQGKGFNRKFMTSMAEPTATGKIYSFCFEYGYHEERGYVTVIRREREVE